MNTSSLQRHHARYRTKGGHALIELKAREIRDLFNTLDPAPFQRKDLNADAEEYIVDAIHELGLRRPTKILVYLPPSELDAANAHGVVAAFKNYFNYRTQHTALALRRLIARGIISLLIALLFMFLCLSTRQAIVSGNSIVTSTLLQEGLLILGWVAMWRPIEIFLYDWWPVWRELRVYRRIAKLPVELAPRSASVGVASQPISQSKAAFLRNAPQ